MYHADSSLGKLCEWHIQYTELSMFVFDFLILCCLARQAALILQVCAKAFLGGHGHALF